MGNDKGRAWERGTSERTEDAVPILCEITVMAVPFAADKVGNAGATA